MVKTIAIEAPRRAADNGGRKEFEIFHNTKCPPEIVITYACNKTCPYCYAKGQAEGEAARTTMAAEKFRRIAGWLKEVIPNMESITILGGEPLILPNLSDYLDAAEAIQIKVNFFTNGSFGEKQGDAVAKSPITDVIYFHYEPLHFTDEGHGRIFFRNAEKILNAGKQVKLRVNFHGTSFDYREQLAFARRFGIPFAWSFTSPAKNMGDYVRLSGLRMVGDRLPISLPKPKLRA